MADGWPRATIEVAAITLVVFAVQTIATLVGLGIELFALSAPLTHRPWTVVTSVYAHGGVAHLVTNLVAILLFGAIVERRTTRWRFHAFVFGTGAVAGIAQVTVGSLLGPSPLVLGISGAVFALMGYALVSNPVADRLLGSIRMDPKTRIVLVILFAGVVTLASAGERVALIAHFTGFVLGLGAGRGHLLRVR